MTLKRTNPQIQSLQARVELCNDIGLYGHELATCLAGLKSAFVRMQKEPEQLDHVGVYHRYVAVLTYLLDNRDDPDLGRNAQSAGLDAQLRFKMMCLSDDELLKRLGRLTTSSHPASRLIAAAEHEIERRQLSNRLEKS